MTARAHYALWVLVLCVSVVVIARFPERPARVSVPMPPPIAGGNVEIRDGALCVMPWVVPDGRICLKPPPGYHIAED